jgi:FKBP-type peptidyl-prolyl cis-trans isomerase FkpA
MRKALLWSLATVLVAGSSALAAGPELKTDEQKTMYAIGLAVSRSLVPFSLTASELELVKAGITDGVTHKEPKVDLQVWGPKIQQLQAARQSALAASEKKVGQAFLDKAAAEKGATKTASGLVFSTITPGNGATPKATDRVKVNYTGTLIDGTVFDSSAQHKEAAVLQLNGVIPCWTEGLQLMHVGGKAKLVCPAALAYGDRGAPPRIKPGETIVFEVELLEILK